MMRVFLIAGSCSFISALRFLSTDFTLLHLKFNISFENSLNFVSFFIIISILLCFKSAIKNSINTYQQILNSIARRFIFNKFWDKNIIGDFRGKKLFFIISKRFNILTQFFFLNISAHILSIYLSKKIRHNRGFIIIHFKG